MEKRVMTVAEFKRLDESVWEFLTKVHMCLNSVPPHVDIASDMVEGFLRAGWPERWKPEATEPESTGMAERQ